MDNFTQIANMVCREFGQHNHKLLFEGVASREDLPCCHGTRKRFGMLWRECEVCEAKGWCAGNKSLPNTPVGTWENWQLQHNPAVSDVQWKHLPCDGIGYILIEHGKLKRLMQAA